MPQSAPSHRSAFLPTKQERDRYYKAIRGDKQEQRFYKSPAWRALRLIQLTMHPYCANHMMANEYVPATMVHHEKDIKSHPEKRLDMDNLVSLCKSCHSRLHAREDRGG